MKALGLVAAVVAAASMMAAPAAARDLRCNGVVKGKTYDDVVVPRGAACTLIGARVRGDVVARKDAYVQATRTRVRGDVEGKKAQTVFVDEGSKVAGSVEADRAVEFYVFNSTVGEDIEPQRTSAVVQICGNTVRKGNIEVRKSGPDPAASPGTESGTGILIGDPLAEGCKGNVVKRGDVTVLRNFADVEFVVRGNIIRKGDLEVSRNTGPAPKIVESNSRGARLVCTANTLFSATGNTGWDRRLGQCA